MAALFAGCGNDAPNAQKEQAGKNPSGNKL